MTPFFSLLTIEQKYLILPKYALRAQYYSIEGAVLSIQCVIIKETSKCVRSRTNTKRSIWKRKKNATTFEIIHNECKLFDLIQLNHFWVAQCGLTYDIEFRWNMTRDEFCLFTWKFTAINDRVCVPACDLVALVMVDANVRDAITAFNRVVFNWIELKEFLLDKHTTDDIIFVQFLNFIYLRLINKWMHSLGCLINLDGNLFDLWLD